MRERGGERESERRRQGVGEGRKEGGGGRAIITFSLWISYSNTRT